MNTAPRFKTTTKHGKEEGKSTSVGSKSKVTTVVNNTETHFYPQNQNQNNNKKDAANYLKTLKMDLVE